MYDRDRKSEEEGSLNDQEVPKCSLYEKIKTQNYFGLKKKKRQWGRKDISHMNKIFHDMEKR